MLTLNPEQYYYSLFNKSVIIVIVIVIACHRPFFPHTSYQSHLYLIFFNLIKYALI